MTFSQYGEDDILDRFFGEQITGFFVEAGALDGVYLSNTLLFERQGWQGILCEPDKRYHDALRASRPCSACYDVALVAEGPSRVVTLHESSAEALSTISPARSAVMQAEGIQILNTYEVQAVTLHHLLTLHHFVEPMHDGEIDLISIDTEATSHETLAGARIDYWRPRVVLIEVFTEEERQSIAEQMAAAKYHLAHVNATENYLYVRDARDIERMQEAAREQHIA